MDKSTTSDTPPPIGPIILVRMFLIDSPVTREIAPQKNRIGLSLLAEYIRSMIGSERKMLSAGEEAKIHSINLREDISAQQKSVLIRARRHHAPQSHLDMFHYGELNEGDIFFMSSTIPAADIMRAAKTALASIKLDHSAIIAWYDSENEFFIEHHRGNLIRNAVPFITLENFKESFQRGLRERADLVAFTFNELQKVMDLLQKHQNLKPPQP